MFDFILVTPTHGVLTAETQTCVEELFHTRGLTFRHRLCNRDGIGRSRSYAATAFIEGRLGEAPYLIFLDGDIVFKPSDIDKMLLELDRGKDIVAGLYSLGSQSHLALYDGGRPLQIDKTCKEIQYVSTGFFGTSKAILEKVAHSLPLCHEGTPGELYPFFTTYPMQIDGQWVFLSEDWDYCDKVRKVGGTVWVHTGIQLGHSKTKIVRLEDVMTFEKEEK